MCISVIPHFVIIILPGGIWSCLFCSKLHAGINGVDMLQEPGGPMPFLGPWLYLNQTEPFQQWFIESPLILTSSFTETAIITLLLNIVSLTPYHTESGLFVSAQLLQKDEDLSEVLQKCTYPTWTLN